MLRHGLRYAFMSIPLLAAACSPFGDEDLDAANHCSETVTTLEGPEVETALGFRAADVMAMAEGSHEAPIFWHQGDIQFGPESGEGELSVTVSYDGGEVRYVESTSKYGDGDGALDEGCHDRIEIDAQIELSTAGGALAESFEGTLQAMRADAAMLVHELELDELDGELEVTDIEPEDGEATALTLSVGISEFGLFGSFDGGIQIETGDAVGFGGHNYATFPADRPACDFPFEAPVPLDATWGSFSASEALALLDDYPDLELQWDGDEATPLSVLVQPADEVACGSMAPGGDLRFDVDLTMSSEDGRLDGSLGLQARTVSDAQGQLEEISISHYAPYADHVALDEFEDRFGVHGVDLSGYDGAGITFDLTCNELGHFGAITVLGATVHECSDEPGAGCEGTDMTELEGGTWAPMQ